MCFLSTLKQSVSVRAWIIWIHWSHTSFATSRHIAISSHSYVLMNSKMGTFNTTNNQGYPGPTPAGLIIGSKSVLIVANWQTRFTIVKAICRTVLQTPLHNRFLIFSQVRIMITRMMGFVKPGGSS